MYVATFLRFVRRLISATSPLVTMVGRRKLKKQKKKTVRRFTLASVRTSKSLVQFRAKPLPTVNRRLVNCRIARPLGRPIARIVPCRATVCASTLVNSLARCIVVRVASALVRPCTSLILSTTPAVVMCCVLRRSMKRAQGKLPKLGRLRTSNRLSVSSNARQPLLWKFHSTSGRQKRRVALIRVPCHPTTSATLKSSMTSIICPILNSRRPVCRTPFAAVNSVRNTLAKLNGIRRRLTKCTIRRGVKTC